MRLSGWGSGYSGGQWYRPGFSEATSGWFNVVISVLGTFLVSIPVCFLLTVAKVRSVGSPSKDAANHRKETGIGEVDQAVLMAAMEESVSPEKLRSLVAGGADVNERNRCGGQTALSWAAAFSSDPDVIRVLPEAGAEVDAVDDEGNSPLMIAAMANDNPRVIKVPIEAGAEVNARSADGSTPLTYARMSRRSRVQSEVIERLRTAGAR
jgi:ankyrin repeat protein